MNTPGNGRAPDPSPIIGDSPAISDAKALAKHFAATDLPVLVLGETGTGKELLAQWVHQWSGRRREMVDINCAAIPRELVEAELFGHGSRAFTGAREGKAGLIEAADSSSLFLDEVASLPWEAQGKLLRVLETGYVRRVGETGKRPVNVRFIAAAQEDLPERVAGKAFRADLYHRLAGVVIGLSPLASRSRDVLLLASHFALGERKTLAAETTQVLLRYGWPGNVRELRYAVGRAACLAQGGVISAAVLTEAIALGAPDVSHSGVVQNGVCGERMPSVADLPSLQDPAAVLRIGRECAWDAARMAEAFGIGRTWLFRGLKAHGFSLRRLKRAEKFTKSTSSTSAVNKVNAVKFETDEVST